MKCLLTGTSILCRFDIYSDFRRTITIDILHSYEVFGRNKFNIYPFMAYWLSSFLHKLNCKQTDLLIRHFVCADGHQTNPHIQWTVREAADESVGIVCQKQKLLSWALAEVMIDVVDDDHRRCYDEFASQSNYRMRIVWSLPNDRLINCIHAVNVWFALCGALIFRIL